ncbi:MAG: hypothetical protein MR270_03640 [Erysipelotrichaceae bacterium]|nr:hypothetical protein [Erysipelotrichaceae bacterium]
MNNFYIIVLSTIMTVQICTNIVVANRIDNVLNLINPELVSQSISERSKLEYLKYNDISYLAISQETLKEMVDIIMSNLSFLNHKEYYYFYDAKSLTSCSIGNNKCNSVQIKIVLEYLNKTYEEVVRYEPI